MRKPASVAFGTRGKVPSSMPASTPAAPERDRSDYGSLTVMAVVALWIVVVIVAGFWIF